MLREIPSPELLIEDPSVKNQVEYVLEHFPETRSDVRWLLFRVWQQFYGFPTGPWMEAMIQTLAQPETIRRVARKIQNEEGRYSAHGRDEP